LGPSGRTERKTAKPADQRADHDRPQRPAARDLRAARKQLRDERPDGPRNGDLRREAHGTAVGGDEGQIDELLAVGVSQNPPESLSARLIIRRAVEDEFDAWVGMARYERRPD
jgi:hypothetical protein